MANVDFLARGDRLRFRLPADGCRVAGQWYAGSSVDRSATLRRAPKRPHAPPVTRAASSTAHCALWTRRCGGYLLPAIPPRRHRAAPALPVHLCCCSCVRLARPHKPGLTTRPPSCCLPMFRRLSAWPAAQHVSVCTCWREVESGKANSYIGPYQMRPLAAAHTSPGLQLRLGSACAAKLPLLEPSPPRC